MGILMRTAMTAPQLAPRRAARSTGGRDGGAPARPSARRRAAAAGDGSSAEHRAARGVGALRLCLVGLVLAGPAAVGAQGQAGVPVGILPAAVQPPRPSPVGASPVGGVASPEPVKPPTAAAPEADRSAFERDQDAPLAGYTNGAPFIRSRDSNFVLFPNGRLNVDGFFFPNRGDPQSAGSTPDGVTDQRPRDTIFVRRARAELNGTILKHIDFLISGEFATIPLGAQSASISDAFLNANFTPWANIMVGQFDAPFTLENRTVDKYLDFMERSITVRAFGIPSNKELGLMVHGLAPSRIFHYEVGVFNGDGINVRNSDNHFDVMGRAYLAPLALIGQSHGMHWPGEIWLGGSLWWGRRIDVNYDAQSLTTQAGVDILPTQFGGAAGTLGCTGGCRFVPNGELLKWAVELNVPIGPLGFRFELVHDDHEGIGVYRATDGSAAERLLPLGRVLAGNINRTGTSFYMQAWYWIVGSSDMLPTPGRETPQRWHGYHKGKEQFPLGVYVTARYERLSLRQEEADSSGTLLDTQRVGLGNLTVDSFGAAVNVWWSRHFRFSANYLVNYLDGDMPLVQGDTRIPVPASAAVPQPTIPFYRTAEHELLFRAAIAL